MRPRPVGSPICKQSSDRYNCELRFRVLVAAAALFAVTPFASAQATGQAASDGASRLNGPRPESIAGNSVDAGTGAFLYTVPTITVQGGRAMDFPLLYHSLATMSGGRLGPGWTHPYEASLSVASNGDAIVHWDSYRKNTYTNTSGNSFAGADESANYDRVVASTNIFTVTRRDGTAYEFDRNNGRLREIRNHVGQEIRVQYDSDGRPNRVIEDITNKDIDLVYDPAGRLVELQDPAGARTLFAYNSAGSLDAVHSPATFDNAPVTLTGPVPISPGSSAFFTLDVSGPAEVGAIRLDSLNLAHADAANSSIILESPRGTVVNITARASRPSPSVFDFDDVLIGDFAGEDPRGRWRLRINDGAPSNSSSGGELNQWRMYLSGPTYPTYFVYDSQSRLRRIEDSQRARILANTYDFQGRVVAQDDGLGTTHPRNSAIRLPRLAATARSTPTASRIAGSTNTTSTITCCVSSIHWAAKPATNTTLTATASRSPTRSTGSRVFNTMRPAIWSR